MQNHVMQDCTYTAFLLPITAVFRVPTYDWSWVTIMDVVAGALWSICMRHRSVQAIFDTISSLMPQLRQYSGGPPKLHVCPSRSSL